MNAMMTAISLGLGISFGVPLVFIGSMTVSKKVGEFLKIKKGFVKNLVILKNQRIKYILAKPKGNKMEMKISGEKKTFKFDNKRIIFEGNTPIALFREEGLEQLNLLDKKFDSPIDSEYYNELLRREFNLGRLAMNNETSKIMTFLFICLIACVIAAGAGVFNYMAINNLGNFIAGG